MKNVPLKVAACVAPVIACVISSLLPVGAAAQVKQSRPAAQVKPAKPGERLSPMERDVLEEMNLARTRPAEYAGYLEQLKPFYKGNVYAPAAGKAYQTQEGWSAVEEAIRFLRSTKPLQPLNVAEGMCSGAGELVRDQTKTGQTGHKASDGSLCEQRLMRFGMWAAPVGENLSYGMQSARERVMELIIDDGFSSRGHRARIFEGGFKFAGVACGQHSSMGSMCVITLAGGFTDKGAGQKTASPTAGQKTASPQPPRGAMKF